MFPSLDKFENEQFLKQCDMQLNKFQNEFISEQNDDY